MSCHINRKQPRTHPQTCSPATRYSLPWQSLFKRTWSIIPGLSLAPHPASNPSPHLTDHPAFTALLQHDQFLPPSWTQSLPAWSFCFCPCTYSQEAGKAWVYCRCESVLMTTVALQALGKAQTVTCIGALTPSQSAGSPITHHVSVCPSGPLYLPYPIPGLPCPKYLQGLSAFH